MNLKNEKGITLIDVAISIVIIAIFTAINIAIFYNTQIASIETKRNNTAIQKLVQKVEQIKDLSFDEIVSTSSTGVKDSDGYTYSISVEDYKDKRVLKKVTISVWYDVFEGKTEQKTQKFTITTLKANSIK